MEKIRIKEAIIVEGRYDKNTLSQIVDTTIIETSGFGIFSDRDKLALIKRIAEKRGIIVLTDSDSAGFLIRNHIKGAIPAGMIKQAYIPEISGKEKRKRRPSKEGCLGVEGMKPETLKAALIRAGARFEDSGAQRHQEKTFSKSDMYEYGISGGKNSAEKRRLLLERMGLPGKLSAGALLDVLNSLYSRSEIVALLSEQVLNAGGPDNADK